MRRHFPIIIEQDCDGAFIVSCPVIQSCRSYGETLEEAMANIAEAIEACLPDEPDPGNETTFIGVRDLEIGSAS
jgi:predicted RNase H-like HicB family nuclease